MVATGKQQQRWLQASFIHHRRCNRRELGIYNQSQHCSCQRCPKVWSTRRVWSKILEIYCPLEKLSVYCDQTCVAQLAGTPVFGRRTDTVLRSTFRGRVTTMWVNRPLKISQLGLLSLSSFGVDK